MLGAIIGDIVGSRFEFNNIKTKDFKLFSKECFTTDDSMMTLAIAEAIMEAEHLDNTEELSYNAIRFMRDWGRIYPNKGYGGMFRRWLNSDDPKPYKSYGNGAAMRVSACGFAAKTLDEALQMAEAVTSVTHNHPEGIKGAKATAAAIYLARQGSTIQEIREYIEKYYYKMDFTLDKIRGSYKFNETCQDTVPQALEAFFESTDFEDAIRNAISIGGDSDTLGAITGAVAEAYYGIPEKISQEAVKYLDDRQICVLNRFFNSYTHEGSYKVISAATVKEILIDTKYLFDIYNENAYTDRLKISKGWISYKRKGYFNKKEYKWSYKTGSIRYGHKYENLVENIKTLFDKTRALPLATDLGGFDIRVRFNDGTQTELKGSSNFHDNGLEDISSALLKLIPRDELYPDMLDDGMFHSQKLTMDVLRQMDKNRLVALMYGEYGAMGSPGHVDIIDCENNIYSAEIVYGDADFGLGEVFELFDGYEPLPGYESGGIRWEDVNNDKWLYMYLGFRNHLLLQNQFFAEHGDKLFSTELGERYVNWKKLTKRV